MPDGGWIGDDGWIGDSCGKRGKQGERRKGEGAGREERPMKSRGRSMSEGVDLRENAR